MQRHEVRYAINIEQDLAQVYIDVPRGSGFTEAWNAVIKRLALNPESCKDASGPNETFACFEPPIWIEFAHDPLDLRVTILRVTLKRPWT